MIDTDMAEQILQGDDTHPDILQALGLEILAEVNDLLAEIRQLNNIIGTFDDFMCNNWTPPNLHGLWNELLTKEEEE